MEKIMRELTADCVWQPKKLPPELGSEIKHILEVVGILTCSQSQQKVNHIFINNGQIIYDKLLSSIFSGCEEFIPVKRLELVPGTS
jgi:hypothetical protein